MNKIETAKQLAKQTIAQGQNTEAPGQRQEKEQDLNEQAILELLYLIQQNSLNAALTECSGIDERDSERAGKDMAADGPAGTGSGTADNGMEKAAEGPDTDRVLLDNWGNVYIPPFAVGIADDEDDALRRRKRRGIGR